MLTKPIPTRIPVDLLPRLDAAAKRLGTNRARLIAFCAQTFAEHFERHGMSIMPPNWKTILSELDGRRSYPEAKPDVLKDKSIKEAEEAPKFRIVKAHVKKPKPFRTPEAAN